MYDGMGVTLVIGILVLSFSTTVPAFFCPVDHFTCDFRQCSRSTTPWQKGQCMESCVDFTGAKCLDRKYVCDGNPDCADKADEKNCVQCSPDAFPCDGECRRKELRCDGYPHCKDGADESDCEGLTLPDQSDLFTCYNSGNITILSGLQCDGYDDCPAREDEWHCTQCIPTAFKCPGPDTLCQPASLRCTGSSNCLGKQQHCPPIYTKSTTIDKCHHCGDRCVKYKFLCDGEVDCEDGSDERHCSNSDCQGGSVWCSGRCTRREGSCMETNGIDPVQYPIVLCNGIREAQNGSDEPLRCSKRRTCEKPACKGSISCDDKCVKASRRCDGKRDCSDGRDEQDCPPPFRPLKDCFDCGNGRCIRQSYVCDGADNCLNGMDEAMCVRGKCSSGQERECIIPCRAGSFACNLNSCARKIWRCDGTTHCLDSVDELWCPTIQPPKVGCENSDEGCPPLFVCKDGTTRLAVARCDGIPDCPDKDDEEGCGRMACQGEAFFCDGKCLMASMRCDGYFDCRDGDDERGCEYELSPLTPSSPPRVCGAERFDCGNKCILDNFVCDGIMDCENRADEINCAKCSDSAVMCDGWCQRKVFSCYWERNCTDLKWIEDIPKASGRCDGVHDCADGVDECKCNTREACNGFFCDGHCYPENIRCDGTPVCANGDDEQDCPDGGATTSTTTSWETFRGKNMTVTTTFTIFSLKGITTTVTTAIDRASVSFSTVLKYPRTCRVLEGWGLMINIPNNLQEEEPEDASEEPVRHRSTLPNKLPRWYQGTEIPPKVPGCG